MPALPLDDAGPYVAGAYLVFLALVLLYVGIMAARLARLEADVRDLERVVDEQSPAAREEVASR